MEQDISIESFKSLYEFDQHISFVLFSFLVQIKLFGYNTTIFHLLNILFHLFNVFLIFKLSDKLLRNKNYALLIALLFAIHPMKAESVCWMVQRKDIFFTMFFLLSILSYIKYLKTEKILWFIICMFAGYLSVLSKLPGIVLPAVLILVHYFYSGKISWRDIILFFGLFLFILIPLYEFFYFVGFILVPVILLNINTEKLFKRFNKNERTEKDTRIESFLLIRLIVLALAYLVILIVDFILERNEVDSLIPSTFIVILYIYFMFFIVVPFFYQSKNAKKGKLFFNKKILFELLTKNMKMHIILVLLYGWLLVFVYYLFEWLLGLMFTDFILILFAVFIAIFFIKNTIITKVEIGSGHIFLSKLFSNKKSSVLFQILLFPISFLMFFFLLRNGSNMFQWYFISALVFTVIFLRNKSVITSIFKSTYKNIKNEQSVYIPALVIVLSLFYLLFSSLSYMYINNDIHFSYSLLYLLFPVLLSLSYYFNNEISLRNIGKWHLLFFIFVSATGFVVFYNKLDILLFGDSESLFTRLQFAAYSLNYYLNGFFVPFNLNAMIPYPDNSADLPGAFKLSPVITFVIFGLVSYLIFKIKDKELRKQIVFGLLFFLFNIAVVLHIIPIKGRVIVADRYMYLASFGLIFSTVSILAFIYKKYFEARAEIISKAFVIVLVIVLSSQSYSRSMLWQNDKTFWGDVIEKNPNNHYAQYSLGLYYFERQDFAKALEQYNTAIKIYDKNYEYFTNRGAVYVKTKETINAINDFEKAININNQDFASFNNRGILFMNIGDLENARIDFEIALNIKPDYAEAKNNLEKVNTLLNVKNISDDKNIIQSNELSEYYSKVGVDKAMKGEISAALSDFELAVSYDTLNINSIKNRGNAYAALKMFENAKNDYLKVLELSPNDGGAYMNLGNILHESGDEETACEFWEKALELGVSDARIMIGRFCGF